MTESIVPVLLLVALYCRVSTEEQAKSGYSLPEQRERCLAKAKELLGPDVQVVVFEDTAGGDILDRPGLEKARAFVRDHTPRYFICLDPDRFSRELFLQLLVTKEMEAAGTELVFVQHDYQKTPEGQLFYSLRGAISQFEKAKILERTKRGLRRKIHEGKVANGTKPYGYRYDKQHDTLVIDETEANWVSQIFHWAREGLLPHELCDRLNALGVTTRRGGPWRSSTIQHMLRNTTYVGRMQCLRWNTAGYKQQRQLPKEKRTMTPKERPEAEWVEVLVPGILDEVLFQAVKSTLRTNKRQSQRGKGMLSGLARCSACGGAIHYVSDRKLGYVLRCQNRYPHRDTLVKRPCSLPAVKASIIEEKVWAEVSDWILSPEEMLARSDRQRDDQSQSLQIDVLKQQLQLMQGQLDEKRKEHATTIALLARGRADAVAADIVLDEQKAHIETILREIQQTQVRIVALSATTSASLAFRQRLLSMKAQVTSDTDKVRYVLEHLDLDHRKWVLRQLVREVLLFPGRGCQAIELD